MCFTSTNKSETLESEPMKAPKSRLYSHNVLREKSGLTNYAERNVYGYHQLFLFIFRDPILEDICK